MEAVADLVSVAVKADVFKGLFLRPAVDPVTEDALVGLAELSGAGKDATAVDPRRESEGGAVFVGQELGAFFRGAVERDGRIGGEVFAEAARREAVGSYDV